MPSPEAQRDSHEYATVVYGTCKVITAVEDQHTFQAKVSAVCFPILCGA